MKIFHTMYKDIEAIGCETEDMTAIFLPVYGAKLTSLKKFPTIDSFICNEYPWEGSKISWPVYEEMDLPRYVREIHGIW